MSKDNHAFKVVLVGGEAVGKTNLMNRFKHSSFQDKYVATDTVSESSQDIQLQTSDHAVQLMLQDVPGNEKFVMLNRMYIRDTHAAVVVYDVTNPKSL